MYSNRYFPDINMSVYGGVSKYKVFWKVAAIGRWEFSLRRSLRLFADENERNRMMNGVKGIRINGGLE